MYESMDPKLGVLVWARVKEYLQTEITKCQTLAENADGPELYRLQGELRRLRKMYNLPSALEIQSEEKGE